MNLNEARHALMQKDINHSNLPGRVVIKDCVIYYLKNREVEFLDGLNSHPQKNEIISIFTALTVNDAGITYYLIDNDGSIIVYDRVKSRYVLGNVELDDIRYVKSFPEEAFEFMDFDTSLYYKVATYHGWEKYIVDGMFNVDVIDVYFKKGEDKDENR